MPWGKTAGRANRPLWVRNFHNATRTAQQWCSVSVWKLRPKYCVHDAKMHTYTKLETLSLYLRRMMPHSCLILVPYDICNWYVKKFIELSSCYAAFSTLRHGPRYWFASWCLRLDYVYNTTLLRFRAMVWHRCRIVCLITKSAKSCVPHTRKFSITE